MHLNKPMFYSITLCLVSLSLKLSPLCSSLLWVLFIPSKLTLLWMVPYLLIGNVSNPSINRWGLNTFWYRFWYTDKLYALNLNQDRNFTQLINLYLYHGLSMPVNIFYSPFWYKTSLANLQFPSYYRWITTKNKTLGFTTSYRLRVQTTDIYPMKLWILRYNNWILLNLYWFQPNKYKRRRASFRWKPVELTQADVPQAKSRLADRRLKTILQFNFFKSFLTREYYCF